MTRRFLYCLMTPVPSSSQTVTSPGHAGGIQMIREECKIIVHSSRLTTNIVNMEKQDCSTNAATAGGISKNKKVS